MMEKITKNMHIKQPVKAYVLHPPEAVESDFTCEFIISTQPRETFNVILHSPWNFKWTALSFNIIQNKQSVVDCPTKLSFNYWIIIIEISSPESLRVLSFSFDFQNAIVS